MQDKSLLAGRSDSHFVELNERTLDQHTWLRRPGRVGAGNTRSGLVVVGGEALTTGQT